MQLEKNLVTILLMLISFGRSMISNMTGDEIPFKAEVEIQNIEDEAIPICIEELIQMIIDEANTSKKLILTPEKIEYHYLTNLLSRNLINLEKLVIRSYSNLILPENIRNFTNIEYLYLHNNQLKDIPDGLWNLSKLKKLALHGNQLENILDGILKPKDLGHLSLDSKDLINIPAGIENLTNLKVLSLYTNKLENIPSLIKKFKNIEYLYLFGDKLTSLPTELSDLQKLKELWLGGNEGLAITYGEKYSENCIKRNYYHSWISNIFSQDLYWNYFHSDQKVIFESMAEKNLRDDSLTAFLIRVKEINKPGYERISESKGNINRTDFDNIPEAECNTDKISANTNGKEMFSTVNVFLAILYIALFVIVLIIGYLLIGSK